MRNFRHPFIILLFIFGAMLVGFAPPADEPSLQITETLPGRQIILRAEERVIPFHVPPPEQAQLGIQSATFNVNWNPANCSGSVSSWPTDAKTAFTYALSIWGALINSGVPIEVDACWRSDLGSGVLGSAGPTTIHGNFSGAPQPDTWYPVTLANALSGSDLNSSEAEISANFSSTFSWYYGTDGNAAWDQYDFVSVVLHEVGHGLGFLGTAYVSGSQGYWGYSGYPIIYDRFTESNSGTAILSYPATGSTALAAVLTSDNVFFDGPNANAANGGQRVELYAPATWNSGSSYSHLGQIFDNTENALMTYSLGWGESEHSPGPVTLGIFEDLGWNVNESAQPDLTISKTVSGSNFSPGDPVSFVLTIQNIGDAAATGVVVTDTLPNGISFTSQSDTFAGTVTFNGCSPCTWNLPNLNPGDSGTITLNGTIDSGLPSDFGLTNIATVSATETESDNTNNSSSASIGTFYNYLPFILKNYADAGTMSATEQALFNLINAERASRGLSQLSNSSLLNQVAAAHSADMRDRDFFSHTNPDGDGPGDRLTNAGYNWQTYGETIGAGYTSAQAMFDGWMDSDSHRAILLSTRYTETGIGYETGGSWGHYWTAIFATPQ